MAKQTSVELTRILETPRERVFSLWTDPEELKKWFAPGEMTVPLAEVDLRPGGQYQIVMQNREGDIYSPSGTYEEIVPNEKLVFSWQWADSDVVTRVTVVLRSLAPHKSELTVIHEGFPQAEMRDKHSEGWSSCLMNLEAAV